MTPEEIRARREVGPQSIRYRTENYGYFQGFGQPAWNERTPMQNVVSLRLFDRPVRLNERIVPAARCAEQEVARSCQDGYQPRRLSGIRPRTHIITVKCPITCMIAIVSIHREHVLQLRERVAPAPALPVDAAIDSSAWYAQCWVRSFEVRLLLARPHLMGTMHFEFLATPSASSAADPVGEPKPLLRQQGDAETGRCRMIRGRDRRANLPDSAAPCLPVRSAAADVDAATVGSGVSCTHELAARRD
jgi:hypothetical protein